MHFFCESFISSEDMKNIEKMRKMREIIVIVLLICLLESCLEQVIEIQVNEE